MMLITTLHVIQIAVKEMNGTTTVKPVMRNATLALEMINSIASLAMKPYTDSTKGALAAQRHVETDSSWVTPNTTAMMATTTWMTVETPTDYTKLGSREYRGPL